MNNSQRESQLLPARAMDGEASLAESPRRAAKALRRPAHKSVGVVLNKPSISTASMLATIQKQGFHRQAQSPLFSALPAELRTHIFAYALAERDGATAISEESFWYRPDYTHYRCIDTVLLRTCRAVWLETFAIPRRNVSFRLWLGGGDRMAPRRKSPSTSQRPRPLTPTGFDYVPSASEALLYTGVQTHTAAPWPAERAQIFAQMYALEGDGGRLARALRTLAARALPPRELTLTLRYTDWWYWESNEPLRVCDAWHARARLPRCVQRLALELETRWGKRDELAAIVRAQVRRWRFRSEDDDAEFAFVRMTESDWVGTTRPGGQLYAHHWPLANGMHLEGNHMRYYVVRLVWEKRKKSDLNA